MLADGMSGKQKLDFKISGQSRLPSAVSVFSTNFISTKQPGLKLPWAEKFHTARFISPKKSMYDVVLGMSIHPLALHRTTDAKHIPRPRRQVASLPTSHDSLSGCTRWHGSSHDPINVTTSRGLFMS